jgi:hypothetical protein
MLIVEGNTSREMRPKDNDQTFLLIKQRVDIIKQNQKNVSQKLSSKVCILVHYL